MSLENKIEKTSNRIRSTRKSIKSTPPSASVWKLILFLSQLTRLPLGIIRNVCLRSNRNLVGFLFQKPVGRHVQNVRLMIIPYSSQSHERGQVELFLKCLADDAIYNL